MTDATHTDQSFDIIVYGASGYTGRLVAEALARRVGEGEPVTWAMAGRSADKLAAVRAEVAVPDDTPIIAADSTDRAATDMLARRARVILTTVGPYQLYGSNLVASCAAAGTDYVDLCGEVNFMRAMIDAHEPTATESGARIVFSCGFDSIPFDLGVWFTQQEAMARHGGPAPRVKGRVRAMNGKFSGGTAASLKATLAAAGQDPGLIALLKNHFALTPTFEGPAQPADHKPTYDEGLDVWLTPFIMAAINTRNIHRSNWLLQHAYGPDFRYDEMLVTGSGERGEAAAKAIAEMKMIGTKDDPKPGEGPTAEERAAGSFDILFRAEMPDGAVVHGAVTGDTDPGYGCTSKMITEAALCLAAKEAPVAGGMWTPAPAMAAPLIERLTRHAGMTFTIEA